MYNAPSSCWDIIDMYSDERGFILWAVVLVFYGSADRFNRMRQHDTINKMYDQLMM